jgi:hypothetical protein
VAGSRSGDMVGPPVPEPSVDSSPETKKKTSVPSVTSVRAATPWSFPAFS